MTKEIFSYREADDNTPIPLNGEKGRALVVLLGWMGSKPNQLLKYGDQWRKRGFNTFSFCSKPTEILFIYQIKLKGNQMLRQIASYMKSNPDCESIILSAFSNGGGFYYAHIVSSIDTVDEFKWLKKYVKGTVLDSLPAIRPLSIFTAFKMTSPNIVATFFLALFVPLLVIAFAPMMKRYRNLLVHKSNQWQHLIIYSKADIIVHHEDIDALTFDLKNNLQNKEHLDLICFETSPHVLHLRNHPTEYENKLNHFVNSINRFKTIQ